VRRNRGCLRLGIPDAGSKSDTVFRIRLEASDALGLETFGALLYLKFHRLPFVEGPVALGLDGREMHEDILTGLALDESITFCRVEPLNSTLFSAQF
jgi:hypothetical protein